LQIIERVAKQPKQTTCCTRDKRSYYFLPQIYIEVTDKQLASMWASRHIWFVLVAGTILNIESQEMKFHEWGVGVDPD